MKKVYGITMDALRDGYNITPQKALITLSLILALSASQAMALTVPTAGIGFVFYTIINGIYTTGLGYVTAGCMFFWGCIHLPKDWKDSLGWMAGGLGVGSLVTLIAAAGLTL